MRKTSEPKGQRNGRSREVGALLAAARAVLENQAFDDAAQAILQACTSILGAEAGLVAVRPKSGKLLEPVCFYPGDLQIPPTGTLPLPIRRLCARAAKVGRVVITDIPAKDAMQRYQSGDPAAPVKVLGAPIIIAGNVTGFVVLMNGSGGFSDAETQLAEVFAEMTAVAMLSARTVNGLETNRKDLTNQVLDTSMHLREAEEKYKTLVENLPDIIARFDPEHRYLYVSPAVGQVTDRPSYEFAGKTNRDLGFSSEFADRWDAALQRVFTTGQGEALEFALPGPTGTRYFDCRLVPEPVQEGAIRSVLSVARDVTDRWLAHEAERRARYIADTLREATIVLTRSLDRETVLVTLLDRLRRMVPFDRASVMLIEEGSRVCVRAVFDGDQVVPLAPELRSDFDSVDYPVVHGILKSGTPVMIPDVHAHPNWRLPAVRTSEASWMGVPLFARGDVAGLFSLAKREAGYFNDDHVRLAEAMSSQASVAVENAILFEQMQASATRMRFLSRRLLDAQETERLNIARELHDEAGQALASLRIGLQLLERELAEGGSVAVRIAELVQRTDAVIEGLHRLAADLRPASLDFVGLEAALRQYSQSAGAKFGLDVRFKARGLGVVRLSKKVETALYRVVQEALTNIVRHAHATRVDILLERRGDRLTLMVEDDGVGFQPAQIQAGKSFGLLGIRERAEALAGTLTVESSPGAGTTIVVEVECADPDSDR